ncbi:hypothetical protein B8W99_28300 [Peribacillus simplex]|nr:hypothetical protein B8W99_28300 [Peribacillus simplex]
MVEKVERLISEINKLHKKYSIVKRKLTFLTKNQFPFNILSRLYYKHCIFFQSIVTLFKSNT